MRPESAQDQHDEMLTSRKPKLLPRAEFEALLKERSGSSSQPVSSTAFDPIEVAMQDNPGLTREEAEEMARAWGDGLCGFRIAPGFPYRRKNSLRRSSGTIAMENGACC